MSKHTTIIIFTTAFAVNVVWESFHYGLYMPLHPLSQIPGVTAVAALLDAMWVLAIFVFFKSGFKIKLFAAFLLALLIEQWAMLFGVWHYGENMPIVPVLNAGLSPMLQLMATVLVVELILQLRSKKN